MHRRGFTLIELLAVIAIVLVLLSLLMPTLGNIRGMAMIVRCKAVVKNFGTAAIVYAADSEGRIPSSIYAGCCNGPVGTPWTNAWLGSEVTQGSPGLASIAFFQRPGILQEYMKAPTSAGYSYYKCPLLPIAPLRSGEGSNGGFDYTQFSYTSGALLSMLPRSAWVTKPDGTTETVPAPIYTEEDPRYGNNFDFIDPDHTSINRDGTWHYRQTCAYFCVDGSVVTISYGTWPGPQAAAWQAKGPGGATYNIGNMLGWDIWRRTVAP
jgi:prepilin-type N-terminal cleavage/methylation domain-containing protein